MKRYNTLDGLRTVACIGIIFMHILTNINHNFNKAFSTLINEANNFVFLFMVISSFSMCCGYYNKIKNNEIDLEKFYKKRINKIFPIFAFLIFIDLLKEQTLISLYESVSNLTLMFGFLDKKIEVLGVAWFLGIIFIFYFIFPFFVFLFSNKKRAWIVTFISLLMNILSIIYFNVGKTNFYYSFVYFCIGGLIYLYKDSIIAFFKNKKILNIIILIFATIFFLIINTKGILLSLKNILFCSILVIYAISNNSIILENKITSFIGGISLEMYLSHMVFFRILEKTNLLNMIALNYITYFVISFVVIGASILFAILFQKSQKLIIEKTVKKRNKV